MKMRKLTCALAGAVLASCLFVTASLSAQSEPTMFIKASTGFSTALAAAIIKKKVPIEVVTDPARADYILQATEVDSKAESTGSKFARCMFADCIGINGYSSVAVELRRAKDTAVVWAYQVRKGNSGPLGIQSLSEAIAKHLKHDYLDKHRNG